MTAPNGPSQTALLDAAIEWAGLRPQQVHAMSVHGTGTPLGDPIEVGALGQGLGVKGKDTKHRQLSIVSNKACVGHTEGAAGESSI